MHAYLFDVELVRVAIVLGIVVSILFYARFGVTTGGVIVPGYLALFVPGPIHIIATLAIAVLTWYIVQKHLRPRLMLWGRRLFETELLVALGLQSVWSVLLWALTPISPLTLALYGIGFLIPGIIAHDMARQNVRVTLAAALACTIVVFGLVTVISTVRDLLPIDVFQFGYQLPGESSDYGYPARLLWFAIPVGVLVSMGLYRGRLVFLSDSLRAGGFVTAGYLALFWNKPLDIAFVVACAAVTYLFVVRFLMNRSILFGRSKMAAMFLTGLVVTWLAEFGIMMAGLRYVPWEGFTAITPTVVALLANDSQRQGPVRTIVGAGVSMAFVAVVINAAWAGYQWYLWNVSVFHVWRIP